MEQIVDLIDRFGFNVVMLLLAAYFIKYMFDKFMSLLNEEKTAHKQEIESLTKVIEDNTKAITILTERLGTGDEVSN